MKRERREMMSNFRGGWGWWQWQFILISSVMIIMVMMKGTLAGGSGGGNVDGDVSSKTGVTTEKGGGSPLLFRLNKLLKDSSSTSTGSSLIELDVATFFDITEGSRNFSTFIVLTALDPQHRCGHCREFHKEYQVLATAWQRMNIPNSIYFTFIDYGKGAGVFQQVTDWISEMTDD
jgi:hypothetical protein